MAATYSKPEFIEPRGVKRHRGNPKKDIYICDEGDDIFALLCMLLARLLHAAHVILILRKRRRPEPETDKAQIALYKAVCTAIGVPLTICSASYPEYPPLGPDTLPADWQSGGTIFSLAATTGHDMSGFLRAANPGRVVIYSGTFNIDAFGQILIDYCAERLAAGSAPPDVVVFNRFTFFGNQNPETADWAKAAEGHLARRLRLPPLCATETDPKVRLILEALRDFQNTFNVSHVPYERLVANNYKGPKIEQKNADGTTTMVDNPNYSEERYTPAHDAYTRVWNQAAAEAGVDDNRAICRQFFATLARMEMEDEEGLKPLIVAMEKKANMRHSVPPLADLLLAALLLPDDYTTRVSGVPVVKVNERGDVILDLESPKGDAKALSWTEVRANTTFDPVDYADLLANKILDSVRGACAA